MKTIDQELSVSEIELADKLLMSLDNDGNMQFDEIDGFLLPLSTLGQVNTDNIVKTLERYKYIMFNNIANRKYYSRTSLTSRIVESGGILAYLKRVSDLKLKEAERIKEDIELRDLGKRKLRSDVKLSERQVKVFWPVFVMGIAGFVLSLVNLFNSIFNWW